VLYPLSYGRVLLVSVSVAGLYCRLLLLVAERRLLDHVAVCHRLPRVESLIVCFGADTHRKQTSVQVRFENEDVPSLMRYLERLGGEMFGMIRADWIEEDDGGETLRRPVVTVGELAAMPAPSLVL
jgi:hypothetical protein